MSDSDLDKEVSRSDLLLINNVSAGVIAKSSNIDALIPRLYATLLRESKEGFLLSFSKSLNVVLDSLVSLANSRNDIFLIVLSCLIFLP